MSLLLIHCTKLPQNQNTVSIICTNLLWELLNLHRPSKWTIIFKSSYTTGNGKRRHSMPHTHSEWTTGAGGYVPVSWVTDYRRWWVYDRIPHQVKQVQAIATSLQKIRKSHSIPISMKIQLMKALVWSVATYGCESWTLRKNREKRLDALRWKDWERFCRFCGQQRKQMSGFLTKLE